MSDRAFVRTLIIISLIGTAATVAHSIYIYFAYQNSSIIQFVAREIWL